MEIRDDPPEYSSLTPIASNSCFARSGSVVIILSLVLTLTALALFLIGLVYEETSYLTKNSGICLLFCVVFLYFAWKLFKIGKKKNDKAGP